tara:strand:- start:31 stop:729 length:699 start_codon:yes stop_codon:yes gene_type:complete
MAESFTALGKGNGFNTCLEEIDVSDDAIVSSAPSLAQTMNAYWNFESATFGGATFEPGTQPISLICEPTGNVGENVDGDSRPGYPGAFTVKNSLPKIFSEGRKNYYRHGIEMNFLANQSIALSNGQADSEISIKYFSALYYEDPNLEPYTCIDITFGEPPNEEVVGRQASEKTQTVSQVIISGIPFIKEVSKRFVAENYASGSSTGIGPVPACPTASYPEEPDEPTLTLHTY